MRTNKAIISYENLINKKKRGDILLLIAVAVLSLVGLTAVYSASRYNCAATYGNEYYSAQKHLVGLLLGYGAAIFTAFFDYRKYRKTGIWLMLVSLVLLALVFTPLGFENYGAKRWIRVGGVTVQPSEIAKFSFIVFVAGYFAKDPSRPKKLLTVLPVLLAGGAICLMVILEPNMSITVCFGLLMLTLLFVAGTKTSVFLCILLPLAACVPLLIVAEPYRLQRLSAFLDPWKSPKGEGYQLLQSLYALGSGGWFGVGLFNSRQKFRFLPFSESDFILAVIGEETGFIGLVALFALISFIIRRGIKIAVNCKDFFGYMLSVGVVGIFGIQSLVNALVVTGSIPPTGLPLPLVSAGNTSVIVFCAMFGVLYNVSKGQ